MDEVQRKILRLKNRLIDRVLLYIAVLGTVALTAQFMRDAVFLGPNFFINTIAIISIYYVSVFHHKFSVEFKLIFIVLSIFIVYTSGLFHLGILASGKSFLIGIPVLCSFFISYRKALYILAVFVFTYIIAGYLNVSGKIVRDTELLSYLSDTKYWFSEGITLFLSSFILLFLGNRYHHELSGNLRKLLNQKNHLKESEEKYRKLFMSFPDIIMVSDTSGNIIYGNDNFTRTTGITEKDYRNPYRNARIHPDDEPLVTRAFSRLVKGREEQSPVIENRFIDIDGNIHWFNGRMTKLILKNKLFIQTVTRDITRQKQDEVELDTYRKELENLVQERTRELEETNEELTNTLEELETAQEKIILSEKMASLGVLTAGIAHEINNPLNFLSVSNDILQKELLGNGHSNNESLKTCMLGIRTGIDRISGIVKGLNQFSRNTSSYDEKCDIHSIIRNCLTILNPKLKDKVDISLDLIDEGAVIYGNVGELHQVFMNLISNAVQAIEKTGKIQISTRDENSHLTVKIKDNGHGISADILPRITDPFFTTKPPGEGTGLGLSITYRILKEHRGTISYNSKPGKGTEVEVKFKK